MMIGSCLVGFKNFGIRLNIVFTFNERRLRKFPCNEYKIKGIYALRTNSFPVLILEIIFLFVFCHDKDRQRLFVLKVLALTFFLLSISHLFSRYCARLDDC